MKLAILLFCSLASMNAFAHANFSGHWIAHEGKISSNIGLSGQCTKVEIEIQQTETEFQIKKYQSTCNVMGSSWGPSQMEIRGDKVFQDGEEVGSISNDTFLSVAQEGSVAYAFNLRFSQGSDGKKVMQSYYGVKNGVGAIATEASLTKAP